MPPVGKISNVQVISETNNGVGILSLGPLQRIPKGSLGKVQRGAARIVTNTYGRDGMRYKGLKRIEMGEFGGGVK